MKTRYRPCPFCGELWNMCVQRLKDAHWVKCKTCWAQGPVFGDQAEAIGAWNTELKHFKRISDNISTQHRKPKHQTK